MVISFAHPAFVDRAQGLALAMTQIVQTHSKLWRFFLVVAVPRDTLILFLAYLLIRHTGREDCHRVRDGVDGRIVSHRDYRVSPRI